MSMSEVIGHYGSHQAEVQPCDFTLPDIRPATNLTDVLEEAEKIAAENKMLRGAIKEALDHLGSPAYANEAYVVRILETALNEGRVLKDGE